MLPVEKIYSLFCRKTSFAYTLAYIVVDMQFCKEMIEKRRQRSLIKSL